jgi:LEA14-like dessication related protein
MHARGPVRIALVVPVLLLALAFAFALAGCASFDLARVLKKPVVTVKGAEIELLSFDEARIRFDVALANPNPVGVRLAGFDYRLTLDGAEFLNGAADREASIAARGVSTVPIPVAFRYDTLFAAVARLAEATETPYEMSVGFSFELPVLGRVRVPASLKGTIPVIRVPRVGLAGLRLEQLTLEAASLALSLEIRNPNGFPFGLEALEYSFDVGGRRWAAGRAAKADAIGPRSVGRLYLPITLNLLSAGRTVAEALGMRGPVSYVLAGRAAVTTPLPLLKSAIVPFHLEGQVEIAR